MRKLLSIETFKRLAKANELPEDFAVRQTFATEVEIDCSDDAEGKAGAGSRALTFTISTPVVDRQGDTVSIDGWDLSNYQKNPVVQWAHDYSIPPIAKASKTWRRDGKLKARTEFVPADNPAIGKFADGVLQLYKSGFLSAVSVGFLPRKWAWSEEENRKWGIDFSEQELLEFSCVPVPANPEALVEGRSAIAQCEELRGWAKGILKHENGLYEVLPAVSASTLREIGEHGLTPELAANPEVVALQEAIARLLKAPKSSEKEAEVPAAEVPKNLLDLFRRRAEIERMRL